MDAFGTTSTGPKAAAWAAGFLLWLGSIEKTLQALSCTRYPSKWFPLRPLSHFQVQAWWKGTMVRRFLGPYQELEKYLKGKGEKETGKEKSGAKKKRAK